MPQRPRAAEEELQRGRRSAGLPEGSGKVGLGAQGGGFQLPPPARTGPPYVREKTFLEASRWVRLVQQPRDSAAKSCGGEAVGCTRWGTEPSLSCPPVRPVGHPSPHGAPPHSVQGGVGACEIQERQHVRTAQEAIEALAGGQGWDGVGDGLPGLLSNPRLPP